TPSPIRIGDPLGTSLQALERPGLDIIYSSALVPPDLKVTVQPQAEEATARAREMLAPYSLDLHTVAPGLYAVVRATSTKPPVVETEGVTVEYNRPRHVVDEPMSDVVVEGTREAGEGPDVATAQL